LSVEDYVVFREVGLRGRLPDGCPDPAWKGRNGERNTLFAELLVTTGMRLEEAATLLWPELPPPGAGKSQPLELAPAVTKRGRSRTIRVPNRLLVSIAAYRLLERANALSRADAPAASEVEVVGWDRRGCRVVRDGRRVRVPFARLTARDRMGCWVRGGSGQPEPLVVWVAEGGRPVGVRAWEAIFERACERCCSLGVPVDASPHTLRHTFAVHMLSLLIREQIDSLAVPRADTANASYRRMVGDPLQHLQRLLGHASIASTYTYLDSVTEAQLLVDDAVDRWAAELGTGAEDPPS
jgi:integrase